MAVRLGDARAALDALLRVQLNEAAGVRGYVATRDPALVGAAGLPDGQFDAVAQALQLDLDRLGLRDARTQLDQLRRLHREWTLEVGVPLLRGSGATAAVRRREAAGAQMIDAIRARAALLRARLSAAQDAVERRMGRELNLTVAFSIAVLLAFALVALRFAARSAENAARLSYQRSLVDALQRSLRVAGAMLPGTAMGFAYASATRGALIGGDVLDAWPASAVAGWLLVADASGHGIEAARTAAFAEFALRAVTAETSDPADALARFNRLFLATFDDPALFIVVFLARYDAERGELRYASAGHGSAFVRDASGVRALAPTGPLIGIDAAAAYTAVALRVEPDDALVVTTDGLTEARDAEGRLLGEDPVAAEILSGPRDPQALCDALVALGERFAAHGIADDMAIVATRFAVPGGSVSP